MSYQNCAKIIPYVAHFLSFPVVIDKDGKYITRSGEIVTIEKCSENFHWKKGRYSNGIEETWHRSGRIFSGRETSNDIIGLAPKLIQYPQA